VEDSRALGVAGELQSEFGRAHDRIGTSTHARHSSPRVPRRPRYGR
jgi:hypothetical protein